MKKIICVNCNENLLDSELIDYRASLLLSNYNKESNKFDRISVEFNPFRGWLCGCCEEEITDTETFHSLEPFLPIAKYLSDLDHDLLKSDKTYYINKSCVHCAKDIDEETTITEEGIEILSEVRLKFDSSVDKFVIGSIEQATFKHVSYGCCYSDLETSFDKDKFSSYIEIPFF